MPNPSRRTALLLAATGLAMPRLALAQGAGFPDRPVRIIVPYAAGGITDVMSRATATGLQGVLGQPVVVENRPGANGSVGTLAAARAVPDGTTIVMGITDTFAINQATFRNLPYDQEKDFAPVSMVARVPFAIMVGASQPRVTHFAQLVEEAKKERGRLSFASWGVGSSSHLAMEFIASNQGFEKLHVPFSSQAPGMQAVAAGQVDAMVLPVGGADSLARDGRARILGVAAPQRLELTPNAPTLTELGVPLSTGLWLALYAPARTPPAIIARLNEAFRVGCRNDQLLAAFRNQAAVPEPSSPDDLASFAQRERQQWAQVVRQRNIVVE
jgi:tripartite-type tricarboxylate transporter receptor subunit TctC